MNWSRAKSIDLGLATAATVCLVLALTYWRPVSTWWVVFYVAFAGAMWAAFLVKGPRGRWRYTLLVASAVLVWLTVGFLRQG